MLVVLALAFCMTTAAGQESSVRWSGAFSTYYSYSVNMPDAEVPRPTTQPARNGEFSIDLAVLSALWTLDDLEATIALQAGTWANVNYSSSVWRHVHQASLHWKIDSSFYVVAGLMPSNIGSESSINAHNLQLSRSLIADWTPYYMAGVGVGTNVGEQVSVAVYAMNGWQVIEETSGNREVSLGTSLRWKASDHGSVAWNTYVGNDEPLGSARLRIHNNLWYEFHAHENIRMVFLADASLLKQRASSAFDLALYGGATASYRFGRVSLVGRVEHLYDPERILALHGTAVPPAPFIVTGASLGVDYTIAEGVLLRTEVRSLHGTDDVFPVTLQRSTRSDTFGTVMLSATW